MKVSVNWLKEFVDFNISVDELVEKIGAQLGAVDEVIDLAPKYKGILISRVVACEKHPNADKLSVCMIDDGGKAKGVKRDKEGLVQVVCGAPNVKAGMLAAWLPPGATVPSSYDKEPFVLEARELRGVVSNGMLASAHELDLSEDHSGVVEIDPEIWIKKTVKGTVSHADALQSYIQEPQIKPGDDFAKTFGLDDHIIDIENKMFTHRPDCFGILGVAREVAGITGTQFKSPAIYTQPKSTGRKANNNLALKVNNTIPESVPRFMAQIFEGVQIGTSPVWLLAKLARAGIKSINNVVDITNYFMVMTGQPMHAYDYDKLPAKSLETRHSKKGEKLKLLGNKEVTFMDNEAILITSGGSPVGIGGVMGGKDTEVDETTKNIVLECANFDMYTVRRTSMTYGLFTDAVTRFSKGQSPLQNDRVLAWAASEMIHTVGATPSSEIFDEGKRPKPTTAVHVRADFINDRLGLEKSAQEMAKVLKNVEFDVRVNGPTLVVKPPFWRTDIEIPEDIVEEIGRLIGYDNLPMNLPMRSIMPPKRNALVDIKSQIRDVLSKAGANEVLSYSFVHGNLIEVSGQDVSQAFKLMNAISPDIQYFRLSLTPSLLDRVHPNIKAGFDEFAIFEIGKTHNKKHVDDKEKLPKEIDKVALVYASKKKQAGAPLYMARSYLDELFERLNIVVRYAELGGQPDYQTAKPFDHRRSAHIIDTVSGQILGIVGEYRSSVKKALKLPEYVSGFELSTAKLLANKRDVEYKSLSRFPSVEQDMTLKVASGLAFGKLDGAIKQAIENVTSDELQLSNYPVDIYLPEGSNDKHVTYRFEIASRVRTMTALEVNKLLDQIATAVSEQQQVRRI